MKSLINSGAKFTEGPNYGVYVKFPDILAKMKFMQELPYANQFITDMGDNSSELFLSLEVASMMSEYPGSFFNVEELNRLAKQSTSTPFWNQVKTDNNNNNSKDELVAKDQQQTETLPEETQADPKSTETESESSETLFSL